MNEAEVYLFTEHVDAILLALTSELGPLVLTLAEPELPVRIYNSKHTTVILNDYDKSLGCCSVWVRGGPWSSSPVLARLLAKKLHCAVRCDPESEYPEVSPYSDIFLHIIDDREALVNWGTGEWEEPGR